MRARFNRFWSALLRFGFRLLYQELAWTYDAISWLVSFGAWRDWQLAALPYLQGPRVLEVGHGPGHMLLALHAAGFQVTGLDLSSQMGTLSRRRLQQAGLQIPLLRGVAQNPPFRSKTFDAVLATFPTDYVLAEETLAAVQRILGDNGRFVIVPQARFSGRSLPERFIEWLYFITGQRYQPYALPETEAEAQETRWKAIKQSFVEAGFMLQIETVTLEGSQVTVMIAEKST